MRPSSGSPQPPGPPPGRQAPYPGLGHLLVLCLVVVPLAQLVGFPWLAGRWRGWAMASAELFLLWLVVLWARRRRWPVEDLLLLNATPAATLAAAGLAAAGAALCVATLDQGTASLWGRAGLGPPADLQRLLLQVQLVDDLPSLLRVLATVVLLPAVCEEGFFRGFVFTGLRYHHGQRAAVGGSALLFAVSHLNPWQLPALLLLGLGLGLLVHCSHSVYPAMLAHTVNNGLSVVAVNLRTHTGADPLGALQAPHPAVVGLAAGALLAGGLWLRGQRPRLPILSPWAPPVRGGTEPPRP